MTHNDECSFSSNCMVTCDTKPFGYDSRQSTVSCATELQRFTAGECFCLLGQNGAGKSTTINCLTGLLPTTAGEALVHGSSVLSPSGLAKARVLLGVCPQFDVLWDNLNGKEHLLLFGAIKGLSRQQAEQQAVALLDKASLWLFISCTASLCLHQLVKCTSQYHP